MTTFHVSNLGPPLPPALPLTRILSLFLIVITTVSDVCVQTTLTCILSIYFSEMGVALVSEQLKFLHK